MLISCCCDLGHLLGYRNHMERFVVLSKTYCMHLADQEKCRMLHDEQDVYVR